jgi:hypothetical protein
LNLLAKVSATQHDLSAAVRAMAVTALLQVRAKELKLKGANPGADAVHIMPELQDTQRRLEAKLAAFKATELAVPMPPQP